MPNKIVKLLFYCTVAKPYLSKHFNERFYYLSRYNSDRTLNGKIVAEADCDLVEDLSKYQAAHKDNHFYYVLKNACLTTSDLEKYCPVKMGEYKSIYGIYLKNVNAFEEPRKLDYYGIKKAPQNMCYLYDKDGKIIAVVISVKSPYMRHIMNDDKTIEVRKSILNIFKELIPNERN